MKQLGMAVERSVRRCVFGGDGRDFLWGKEQIVWCFQKFRLPLQTICEGSPITSVTGDMYQPLMTL